MAKKKKRLTVKEQKFVKAVLEPDMSQAKAVVKAGYKTTKLNATKMGSQMMAKPHIAKAIAQVIDEEFPEAGNRAVQVLREILNDEESSPMVRMKAIEMLGKFKGWQAPTKSMSIKADLGKYKLPGGE